MPSSKNPPVQAKRKRNWRAFFIELLKFGSVGGFCFLFDVGMYNLLVFGPGRIMADNPVTAKILTSGVATIISWLGNRLWTFRDKRSTSQPLREGILYAVINLVAMLFGPACLWVSRWMLDLHTQLADNISANIIGTAFGTIFRYLCYRLIVFNPNLLAKRAKDAAPQENAPESIAVKEPGTTPGDVSGGVAGEDADEAPEARPGGKPESVR